MEFVQGAKSLPVLHWCRALPWACPRCGLARPPPPTAGRVQAGAALGVSTVCVLRPWAPGGPCAGTSAQRGLQRARQDSCPRVPPTPWAAAGTSQLWREGGWFREVRVFMKAHGQTAFFWTMELSKSVSVYLLHGTLELGE